MSSSTHQHDQPNLLQADPEIAALIDREGQRQQDKLEMIASENFASRAVLEAAGTLLTNKYAEGYPGKRYYGGCEVVDEIEELARTRAKQLFAAEYANVQPHSGSSANLAIYFAMLKPGDTIMGMDLAHGGHLTHGARVSISGAYFNAVSYGVSRDSETVDFDSVRARAYEHKPRIIICGYSAYSRIIDFARFRAIADEVGAFLMVDMAHIAGLVATGLHPSPIEHAHFITSTTHKTLRGPRGGLILIGKDEENRLGITAPKSGRTKRHSELIDTAVIPGIQGGPLLHIIAAKAVAFRQALQPSFADYQRRVVANARALATALQDGGARIVSGGTDNHLMLVDLTNFGISGAEAETRLDSANITANKNGIPFDTRSPFITSGIRLGTPALTTRGMGTSEMETIAGFILDTLKTGSEPRNLTRIAAAVAALSARYPLVDSQSGSSADSGR